MGSKVFNFESIFTKYYLKIFLLGLSIGVLTKVNSSTLLFFPITIGIYLTLVLFLFLTPRFLIYPIFFLLCIFPDITQSSEEIEVVGVLLAPSPWQIGFSFITPAFFIFFYLVIATLRLKVISIERRYLYLFTYFIFVSLIFSIKGGYLLPISRFIADAKIPMFFFTGMIFFSTYFKIYNNDFEKNLLIIFTLFAANFMLDCIKLFLGFGEAVASVGYQNLSLDSNKGILVVFILFFMSKLMQRRLVLISLILTLILVYVLLAYQTRWLVVTLALGLIMIFFYLGFKKAITYTSILFLFFSLAIPLIIQLQPEVWRVMLLRFSFVSELGMNTTFADVEIARAGSIYNSLNLLYEKKAFITGLGYGSWFTDNYFPMPNLTISAFDEASLAEGRYYRVHDFTFHFLFKFGIIGIILYAGAFLKPVFKLYKFKKIDNNTKSLIIILIGLCPTIITYMWFASKSLVTCSLYLVITVFVLEKMSKAVKPQIINKSSFE